MPITANYTQQGLQVAHSPQLATLRGVKLPYGGPTDQGGPYEQGSILTNVGGTAQGEIWVITSSLADGTFTMMFVAQKVYSTGALAYNCSTAVLQAALEEIFGEGSVVVTGSAGTSYTITFQENARVGGYVYFSETAGSGSISLSRSQRGSCGAGQYDLYDSSSFTTTDALLEYETLLDPTGARVTDQGTSTGQPFSPAAYQEGFFFVFKGENGGGDELNIPNIDSDAVAAGQKLRLALGGSVSASGAIVRLTQ